MDIDPLHHSTHTHRRRNGRGAAEVIVVLGVVLLLLGLLVPVLSRTRSESRSVTCLSHLHQIAQALRAYAGDNGGFFPFSDNPRVSWERSLGGYVPPGVFSCPADRDLGPLTGSSYDWRDTGVPETTLAGRALRMLDRTDAVLAMDALPGWHAPGGMNAVYLDGSAQSLTQEECLTDLIHPIMRQQPFSPAHALPTPHAATRPSHESSQSLRVWVGGYYNGLGSANVSEATVSIQAQVRGDDDARTARQLDMRLLARRGRYFQGTGQAGPIPMTLSGRLEQDSGYLGFHGVRLFCTFVDANGHTGRVVGEMEN